MKINVWNLLGAQDYSPKAKKNLGIVALLYLIQGAPAAILWEVLPVYFRLHGVSLRAIGGLRLLEFPYSLKVFWSPLVHRYGDRRIWITGCTLGIAGILFSLPLLDVAGVGWIVLGFILSLTTLSATQDVAIDSYSVGLIAGKKVWPMVCGRRLTGWRSLFRRRNGFPRGRTSVESTLRPGGFRFYSACIVPTRGSATQLTRGSAGALVKGLLVWAGTWKVIPLVLFVLTYKLGEFAIGPMVKPFWVDYGKSIWPLQEDLMFQIGLFPTTFGIILSILGALLGGAFITRFGIFHGVWLLGLLQAVSNLGYSFVDWMNLGRFGLYGASMFESLSGGLGTAAFLAFLMNICEKEHATIQYAFLSSIFSLTGRLVGGISGLGAEQYGYGNYFAITFLLSMPAYLLLPWVKRGFTKSRGNDSVDATVFLGISG